MRQRVVVFPKRLRYFLDRYADCLKRVAGNAMSEVQRATAGASTSTAAAGRSGGVLFVHHFGATLSAHVHLHLCILNGVVAQGRQELVFRRAREDEACVERVQAAVRQRVLRLFERRGLLSSETVGVMQGWGHRGGFSVHAAERVAAQDSAGRERLLRYRSLIRHWVEHRLAWCSRLRSALNVYDCRCWIKNNVQSAYVTRLLFLGITNKSD